MPGTASGLARRIGALDATLIVMGGIVGSGIFVTPADVARNAGSPVLILGAWLVGGVASMLTMVVGFRGLTFLTLAVYVGALLALRTRGRVILTEKYSFR